MEQYNSETTIPETDKVVFPETKDCASEFGKDITTFGPIFIGCCKPGTELANMYVFPCDNIAFALPCANVRLRLTVKVDSDVVAVVVVDVVCVRDGCADADAWELLADVCRCWLLDCFA